MNVKKINNNLNIRKSVMNQTELNKIFLSYKLSMSAFVYPSSLVISSLCWPSVGAYRCFVGAEPSKIAADLGCLIRPKLGLFNSV